MASFGHLWKNNLSLLVKLTIIDADSKGGNKLGKKTKLIIVVLAVILLLCVALIMWNQWPKITGIIKAEIEIGNTEEHPGYAGVLSISSAGIKVPLILVEDPDMMQTVVDKMNCAALIKKVGMIVNGQEKDVSWIIGDHSYQKFRKLPEVEVGSESEITDPDGTVRKFIVTKNLIGYNIGGDLVYEDGTSVRNDVTDGLILYTCVDETAIPVHIVFLQPV